MKVKKDYNIVDMLKTPLEINDIVAFPNAYGNNIIIGKIIDITSTGNIKISYKNLKNSKRITHPATVLKMDEKNTYLIEHLLLDTTGI